MSTGYMASELGMSHVSCRCLIHVIEYTVVIRMFGVSKDWRTLLWGMKNISILQYWGQLCVCYVGVSIWGQGQQCQISSSLNASVSHASATMQM
jgi:hypothetical protein